MCDCAARELRAHLTAAISGETLEWKSSAEVDLEGDAWTPQVHADVLGLGVVHPAGEAQLFSATRWRWPRGSCGLAASQPCEGRQAHRCESGGEGSVSAGIVRARCARTHARLVTGANTAQRSDANERARIAAAEAGDGVGRADGSYDYDHGLSDTSSDGESDADTEGGSLDDD